MDQQLLTTAIGYRTWPFIVDLNPWKIVIFHSDVNLPEGNAESCNMYLNVTKPYLLIPTDVRYFTDFEMCAT